ncbi:MAG: hypothetical protein WA064_04490 [Candidatus Moraniibacteriota bacterium]
MQGNPFEQNQDFEKDAKNKFRTLAPKIHPDFFQDEKYNNEINIAGKTTTIHAEADELFKKLSNIRHSKQIGWEERLRKMEEIEIEIEEFLKIKADIDKANGNQDPGKKDKPMNKKEFFAKHPVHAHHFDKEGSSFYIFDYIENTGEVEIKLALDGKNFEKKIIPTVAEFEKLLDEVETKKEKTLREIFEPQAGSAKQNKQEDNSQKKYATEKEYKDYLEKEFGALNQPHTDDNGVSLNFEKYSVRGDLVTVSIVGFDGEPRFKKKLSREAFEEFIRKPAGSRGTIEAMFSLKRKKKKTEQESEEEKKEADAEAEKPEEEKPEMSEEEKKSAEELEKEKIVADTRSFYAKTNFQAEGAYSRLKRVLGKTFNRKVEDVPDVAEAYRGYQEKLKELREFKVSALKEKYLKLSPEERKERAQEMKAEMEQLVTYFNYDEKIRLYESRTNAGAEAQKEHVGGKILAKSAEWVNRYRKMNWKKKLLISGALMAGGALLTMSGVTISGVVVGASLGTARRIFSGAVAGVGAAALAETLARKSQKKKAEKDKKAIFDEFEMEDERNEFEGNTDDKANWEEKFHSFETKLDEEINSYAESLKNERGSMDTRLLIGLGVGAFVATGVPGYLSKWGLGLDKGHGNFHWLSDKLGITKPNINLDHASGIKPGIMPEQPPIKPNIPPVGAPSNIPPVAPSEPNLEQILKAPKDINTEKLVPGSVEKTLNGVEVKSGGAKNLLDVNFKKGDSIEKVLIQKMTDPQGMNLNKAEAGKLAHRMALQYAKEKGIPFEQLNHVQIGDKITFDLEHQKLVDLERMHKMPGHAHNTGASHEPKLAGNHSQTGATEIHKPKLADINPTEHAPQEKIIPVNPLEAQSNMPSGGQALREAALRDEAMQQSENSTNLTPEEQLKYQKIAEANSELIQKNISSLPRFSRLFESDMLEVEKLRMLAHNGTPEAIAYENSYTELVKKMSQAIFTGNQAGENLDSLKNASADDYWQNDGKLNPKLIQLKAYVARKFGEKISDPRSGETVSKWAHRLTFKSLEAGGVELESFVKLKTRH